jgi:hypothetical protein
MISRAATSWVAVRVGDQPDDGRREHGTATGRRVGRIDGSPRRVETAWPDWRTEPARRVWRVTVSGRRRRAHLREVLPVSAGDIASPPRRLSSPRRREMPRIAAPTPADANSTPTMIP